MPTRSECVSRFLQAKTHKDLADLYYLGMECQVNVAQDGGRRIDGEFKGRVWQAWTDDVQTWNSFRIPLHANSIPENNDRELKYDLESHCEAIGMTGWDWQKKKSLWVAFDFDAIVGHKAGLPNEELEKIIEAARSIEWVTVRKSTSGKGLHLYVHTDVNDIQNHNEHAALSRSILGKMSALAGYDFNSKVDIVGQNMWVWHRKMQGTDGLTLIKQGTKLYDIPQNWREHIPVVTKRSTKIRPQIIPVAQSDTFEELSGQRSKVPLDSEHRKLINWLQEANAVWWWVPDHHMLVTHTIYLQEAHVSLSLKGKFETLATGKERGSDTNCYMFPTRRGGWTVRRFSQGVQEAATWSQDTGGWTKCNYNREPDLGTACRSFDGVEHPNGGYVFREAEVAQKAVQQLGVNMNLPTAFNGRPAKVKPHKDGHKLIVEIEHKATDSNLEGWLMEKGVWKRVFSSNKVSPNDGETTNFDDTVRHLVTNSGDDSGWVLKNDEKWRNEPLVHVRASLKSMDLPPKEVDEIIGGSVTKCWTLVNLPFKEEYPGDRQWNRNAAQFRFLPTNATDNLSYPSWKLILDHVGSSLDSAVSSNGWCIANGILSGADYLKCWCASLFQFPTEPLPYLFMYGPQDSGKSIFHEALGLLVTKGYERADQALVNQSGFNAELENAILCVIEEIDLKRNSQAYNRIKDWVVSRTLLIHRKGETPYTIQNTTHFVQCANNFDACPVFSGDTRITMIFVDSLEPMTMIPKNRLILQLEKEAPDFLAEILKLELPSPNDRLNIPVIATSDKRQIEEANQDELQRFIKDFTWPVVGCKIKYSDFVAKFLESLDASEVHKWTRPKIGRELGPRYPKARLMSDGAQFYIGNISWNKADTPLPKLIIVNDKLIPETK